MKKTKNNPTGGTVSSPRGQNNRPSRENNALTEDDLLVARCKDGNIVAFGKLIEKYQDRLFNTILRQVGSHDDALELTQESFFRAMKGIKKFRGNAGFYTWLFRIGMNLSINHRVRSQKVRFTSIHRPDQEAGHQADGLISAMASRESSPAQKAQVNESYDRALRALENLEPPARAVVVLRDIEGLNYAQIAQILEVPTGTVKSRLARARAFLREQLMEK